MSKNQFFILESLAIIFTCIAIGLTWQFTLSFLLFLFLVKAIIGNPKHYGKMYKCAIWSYVVFVGLMFVAKESIYLSVLATIVTGYVTSEKSDTKEKLDITDIYEFKAKYILLDDFLKFNYNDPRVLTYEDYLKAREPELYSYFEKRFKLQIKNPDKLEEIFGKDRKYIYNKCDIIYFRLKETLVLYED